MDSQRSVDSSLSHSLTHSSSRTKDSSRASSKSHSADRATHSATHSSKSASKSSHVSKKSSTKSKSASKKASMSSSAAGKPMRKPHVEVDSLPRGVETVVTQNYFAGGTVSGGHSVSHAYESHQSQHLRHGERIVSTSVIGHELGASRVISVTEHAHGDGAILNETVHHATLRLPKKILREEIIEKTIVVPERIVYEEVIDVEEQVEERVIEVSKPIIKERIVEIPEIEIVETIIEYPEKKVEERIITKPVPETRERIVEKPVITYEEQLVEVPTVKYNDIETTRCVDVPEVRVKENIVHKPVPQYVEKPVPQVVTVDVKENVHRKIPVPVEAVTTFEYELPVIQPHYKKVKYPVYLPRFIEVPVAQQLLSEGMLQSANQQLDKVHMLGKSDAAISLCDIENLAAHVRKDDLLAGTKDKSFKDAMIHGFETGHIKVHH